MIEKLKQHPYLAIAGLVAVLVLVYIFNHSGSGATSTAAVGGDGTDVGAASSLLAAQNQAAAQSAQINGAIAANKDNNDAAITLATINAQQSGAHDALAAGVATSQINASQQIQSLLGSLSADVQKTGINADLQKTTVLANNQTEQQQILANALVAQSTNQAQVSQAAIQASSKGLFSRIFG